MKVSGDLLKYFGDLDFKTIVEIGGGYGGQCKILNELTNFKEYIIVDLLEATLLQKRYLNRLNVKNVEYLSNKNFSLGNDLFCDLLISNYAFSEISRDEQFIYIRKLINNSRRGYMTCNFISGVFGIKSLNLNELVQLIKIPGRKIEVIPEVPCTYSGNVILIWREE